MQSDELVELLHGAARVRKQFGRHFAAPRALQEDPNTAGPGQMPARGERIPSLHELGDLPAELFVAPERCGDFVGAASIAVNGSDNISESLTNTENCLLSFVRKARRTRRTSSFRCHGTHNLAVFDRPLNAIFHYLAAAAQISPNNACTYDPDSLGSA